MSMAPPELSVESYGKVRAPVSARQVSILKVEKVAAIKSPEREKLARATEKQGTRRPSGWVASLSSKARKTSWDQSIKQLCHGFLDKGGLSPERRSIDYASLRE